MTSPTRVGALAGVLLSAGVARAQEAMETTSATMPSPGVWLIRPQFHVFQYGLNPGSGVERTTSSRATLKASVGLDRALALNLDIPLVFERTTIGDDDTDDAGVEDLTLTLARRVYSDDLNGLDTTRIIVFGGAAFASGDDHDFSSQSVNPRFGAALTMIRGRHGISQDLVYTLNTGGEESSNLGGQGPADALSFNFAYVYRLDPSEFTSESRGAWYAVAQLNGLAETNGDADLRFTPGLMYEGRRWTVEAMMQFPLLDDLAHRPELDWGIGIGARLTF